MRAIRAHPAATRRVLFVAGSLGAAYLLAATTGHGLHGLKGAAALDKPGQEIPDANLAWIAAVSFYFGGSFMHAYFSAVSAEIRATAMRVWSSFLACAVAGGAVFLVALGVQWL